MAGNFFSYLFVFFFLNVGFSFDFFVLVFLSQRLSARSDSIGPLPCLRVGGCGWGCKREPEHEQKSLSSDR